MKPTHAFSSKHGWFYRGQQRHWMLWISFPFATATNVLYKMKHNLPTKNQQIKNMSGFASNIECYFLPKTAFYKIS